MFHSISNKRWLAVTSLFLGLFAISTSESAHAINPNLLNVRALSIRPKAYDNTLACFNSLIAESNNRIGGLWSIPSVKGMVERKIKEEIEKTPRQEIDMGWASPNVKIDFQSTEVRLGDLSFTGDFNDRKRVDFRVPGYVKVNLRVVYIGAYSGNVEVVFKLNGKTWVDPITLQLTSPTQAAVTVDSVSLHGFTGVIERPIENRLRPILQQKLDQHKATISTQIENALKQAFALIKPNLSC